MIKAVFIILKKILTNALFCAAAACAGVFLAVRLRAFLVMAWGYSFPAWLLWPLTGIITLVPLFTGAWFFEWRKDLKRTGTAAYCLLTILSIAFCAAYRSAVIDLPLAGTGVAPGRAAYLASVAGAGVLLSLFLAVAAGTVRQGFFRLRRVISSLTLKDAAFLGVLLGALNFFAYIYIHRSHTINFGDNAGYWTKSVALAETARTGLVPLVKAVYHSVLTQDYNSLIVVPWMPLVLQFGPTRWVFIDGIVNLALFPVLALLYLHLKGRCRRPVTAAVGVLCFLPMPFYTAVTGFVDIAGVIFTLGAMLLWLGGRSSVYRFFTVGCLLAFAVLLRRWYAFFAVSFFIAAAVDCLLFRKTVRPLMTAAAAFAFSLLFLFQPFVAGLLLKNYASLYSAFSFNLIVDVRYIFYYFGIFVIGILLFASIYFISHPKTRQPTVFLLVQPSVCFALFVHVQSHGQQHLLLYIPALMLLAAALFSALADRILERRFIAAVLAVCALLPFVQPLVLKTRPNNITDIKAVSLLPSFIYVPPRRDDADVIVALVRYLDETVGAKGKTVGVLSSSMKLNIDILTNAEASLNLERTSDVNRRYIVWLSEIDSRDPFPGALLDVDYLLVADPVQVQLGTAEQRCIALPALQVLAGTGIGAAYRPVGDTFNIGDGSIRVRLYEKIRDITSDEKNALMATYKS